MSMEYFSAKPSDKKAEGQLLEGGAGGEGRGANAPHCGPLGQNLLRLQLVKSLVDFRRSLLATSLGKMKFKVCLYKIIWVCGLRYYLYSKYTTLLICTDRIMGVALYNRVFSSSTAKWGIRCRVQVVIPPH